MEKAPNYKKIINALLLAGTIITAGSWVLVLFTLIDSSFYAEYMWITVLMTSVWLIIMFFTFNERSNDNRY